MMMPVPNVGGAVGLAGRLRGYRLRAGLAAMGIAVGAAGIVFLVDLTSSALAGATKGMVELGADTLRLSPRAPSGPWAQPLTMADLETIRARVAGVTSVVPTWTVRTEIRACGLHVAVRATTAEPASEKVERLVVRRGRFLHARDPSTGVASVVVGADLVRDLPCLAKLPAPAHLGDRAVTVVGLVTGPDDEAGIPSAYAFARTIRRDPGGPISSATVRIDDAGRLDEARKAIRRVLRARHHLPSDAPDDVNTQTREELAAGIRQLERTAAALVVWLLGLSLVVAAIGTLNALMTSVVERTSEIGLRRAVGATRLAIRLQFVAEALVITVSGALGGVSVGALSAAVVSWSLELPVRNGLGPMLVAGLLSTMLGVMAGVWPAMRAARLSPVEALRHE
ncbi:MAG: ABC transporter permease [Vicinamibacterales bacterium]